VQELYNLSMDMFIQYFGKYGVEIYDRIRGIDNREVIVTRGVKSIGRETTLKEDTDDKGELKKYLEYFSEDIEKSL
jgi:DNA polymerase IV